MLYITAVRLNPTTSTSTRHITDVKWVMGADTGSSTVAQMVEWLDTGNVARVKVGEAEAKVQVVVLLGGSPYLRTVADSTQRDNLLSLPRF